MATIKDLKFDDKNFNKHTEFGMSKLEESLRNYGAGRSILIDKDNNIIAGNGIVESAGQIGLENVKIVETTGDEIVAVKRTDVSLNSHKGREMALADNATSALDLEWNTENLSDCFDDEELEDWGIEIDKLREKFDEADSDKKEEKTPPSEIIVASVSLFGQSSDTIAIAEIEPDLSEKILKKIESGETTEEILANKIREVLQNV